MHNLFAQGSPAETPVRDKSQGSLVWEAYRHAYIARYGHEPVRNAKTNGQCSQLVARLGAEAAQKVVQFYLSHGGRWYVQQCHGLGWCLRDCEGLHTQMLANYRVTSSDADSIDRNQSNQQAFEEVAKRLEAEGRL